jgi:hypothetical protein
MAGERLLKEPIVNALAVGRIADDRMRDVLQVAAQLVAPAGDRHQRHQRVASARIASDRIRQLDGGQAAVVRDGLLDRARLRERARFIGFARERVVDAPGQRRPAAHDRPIRLAHTVAFEGLAEPAGRVGIKGEQQHPRGALVQPVDRLHAPADLIAQQLHREAGLVPVDVAAVDQQAGGLVDRDQVFVAVKNLEHGGSQRLRMRPVALGRRAGPGAWPFGRDVGGTLRGPGAGSGRRAGAQPADRALQGCPPDRPGIGRAAAAPPPRPVPRARPAAARRFRLR